MLKNIFFPLVLSVINLNVHAIVDKQAQGEDEPTRLTMYTDLVIEPPAQLIMPGTASLSNVTVSGNLFVTGQENLNNQFFIGTKTINFSSTSTPANILTFRINPALLNYPIAVDLKYIANTLTNNGKPQQKKPFFCYLRLLLSSDTIWATFEKVAYINAVKDGTVGIKLAINNGVLSLAFSDYTTNGGDLFYSVWGISVTGVS